jgi:hypothetical protein
MKET